MSLEIVNYIFNDIHRGKYMKELISSYSEVEIAFHSFLGVEIEEDASRRRVDNERWPLHVVHFLTQRSPNVAVDVVE